MADLWQSVMIKVARNAADLASLPRKVKQAQDIYKQERDRSLALAEATGERTAADNAFDAMRHGEASRRVTELLGPGMARLAGDAVEVGGLARSLYQNARQMAAPHDRRFQDTPSVAAALSSMRMDQHNNAEGRRAALEGRAVDPTRLKTAPDYAPPYGALYDTRAPRRKTTAGR